MITTYPFYHDAGHAWLAVSRKELEDLNLLHEISHFSYQKGGKVYLEEDSDAPKFLKAKGFDQSEWGSKIKEVCHGDVSRIRSYSSFAQ